MLWSSLEHLVTSPELANISKAHSSVLKNSFRDHKRLSKGQVKVHDLATSPRSVKRSGPRARVNAVEFMSHPLCRRQAADLKNLVTSSSNCSNNDSLCSSRQGFTLVMTCKAGLSLNLTLAVHHSTRLNLPRSNSHVKALHMHAVTVQASMSRSLESDGSEKAIQYPSDANRPIEAYHMGMQPRNSHSNQTSRPLQIHAEMCPDRPQHH